MSVFDDALGVPYLPPSPVYPIDQLVAAGGAALPGNAALAGGLNVPVGAAATPAAPGPPLPIGPPAQTAAGGGTGVNLQQILSALEPRQQSGLSTPRFMSALGAGLSSAGQNWSKPAAAAFASGAGAAIQGGQSYDNQLQSAKLKALQTAIAAWKVGDLAAYHQATVNLRALSAPQPRPATSAPPAATAPAPPTNGPANNPPVPPTSGTANNPPAPPAGVTGSASGPTVYGSGTPSSAPPPAAPAAADAMAQARDAISRGAPRYAVIACLRQYGVNPYGL